MDFFNSLLKLEEQPAIAQPAAEIVPIFPRITLMELGTSTCRWPIGDPMSADFRFCGARTENGTGITAGAGLFLDPGRITVCELLPEVVDLAERHFRPYVNRLFDDPRVTIHAEDGRHCLARTRESYDAIVADLFTPWKAGTGNLYTLEHYRIASARLKPGGLYVQWIPLYQVSMAELAIIANTMAQVFPQLTIWRGDLYSERSILALIGSVDDVPLNVATLRARARLTANDPGLTDTFFEAMALKFYAGNAASGLFAGAPVNTDNFPLIEYQAPRTQRAVLAGTAQWVTGVARDDLFDALAQALPPERDPYLAALDPAQHGYVEAGRLYVRYRGHRQRREEQPASETWQAFAARIPTFARRPDSPAGQVGTGTMVFGLSDE